MVLDVFVDSLKDVIKMIPIMFAVCLLGEFVMQKKELYIKHGNSFTGVFTGALFGLIPQCGVPVGCAQLYGKKLIGLATIITVFLSSSDEALIIAAGKYDFRFVFTLAVTKVAVGIIFGIILLLLTGTRGNNPVTEYLVVEAEKKSPIDILIKTAISIVYITIYVLIVVFLLNLLIESIGLTTIQEKIAGTGLLQVALTAFIGIIPSCVSSVFVTESYMSGIIGYGALISGLCANTGFGIIVIYKMLPLKKALSFTAVLLGISIFTGIVITIFAG